MRNKSYALAHKGLSGRRCALDVPMRHLPRPERILALVPDPVVRWRLALVALIVVAGLVLGAASAWAAAPDDLSSCTTHTDRAPDDIIIQTSVFEDTPSGITIVEGETLCLAGFVDGSGRVSKIRPADPALNEPPLIMLQMDPAGPTRALHVRTSAGRWLALTAARFNDEGTAHTFRSLHVPPDGKSFAAPDAGVHKFLLYMPRLYEVSSSIYEPWKPPGYSERKADGDLTLLTGARVFRSLHAFDQPLRAAGYNPFGSVAPELGASLGLAYWRVRGELMGVDAWTRANGPAGSIHANLVEVRLTVGFDFLRWRGLTGIALLGIGGSSFYMDNRGPNWDYLGARAASHPAGIMRDAGLLTFGLGFRQYVPFGRADGANGVGLLLSLQAGYSQQFGLTSWASEEDQSTKVEGMPDIDLSGPSLALGLGFTCW
jgi:hypothetical protein